MLEELSREPGKSPFYRILKDSTRKRILDHPEAEPPEALRNAVVEVFNEMLSDTHFAPHFLNGAVFKEDLSFSPGERVFADWLLLSFRDNNVFDRDIKTLNAPGAKKVAQLNKLLIMQRFRKFLKRDEMFTSGFTPPVKAVFEKAGFRLEREYPDVIPFEDIIVFAAH